MNTDNNIANADVVRRWCHEARNAANCLQLCTSAFAICVETSDRLDLLKQIEQSADKLAILIDGMPADMPNSST